MSSIQERLQLKRAPLDTWNTREKLCLASAVVQSGDQNWMSVSRALKTIGDPNRPPDWYSQKSCAAQYGQLLEQVQKPKRKKRSLESGVETPQESILKQLTRNRIIELQKKIGEMNMQYLQLKNRILEVHRPSTSEERLQEIWSNMEVAKKAKEIESGRRAAAMREREERRARSSVTTAPLPPITMGPPPPSSPLLTSLLKSAPVVTTPQHIPHPAGVIETMSPSVRAPTLSMLLEKTPPQQECKSIEDIRSEIEKMGEELKASNPALPSLPAVTTPTSSAVDIDDIEIKEEDVYAFRDIDIHLPQVGALTSVSKVAVKPPDKPIPKRVDEELSEIEVENVLPPEEQPMKGQAFQLLVEEVVPIEVEEPVQETAIEQPPQELHEVVAIEPPQCEDIKVSYPEVKFPTTEIKIIQPDDDRLSMKEGVKSEVVPVEEKQQRNEVATEIEKEEDAVKTVVEDASSEQRLPSPLPPREPSLPADPPSEEPQVFIEDIDTQNIPLPPGSPEIPKPEPTLPVEPVPEVPPPPPPEAPEPDIKVKEPEPEPTAGPSTDYAEVKLEEHKKRDEDEDSIPLKQMIRDEPTCTREEQIIEETHTETDDDTPMELSREEEKDGKKKRDYSRKKKPDSRTCSGSESAAEVSAPESPSANDAERQRRLWKKSVMLVYGRLCAHKYASLFLRPISDDEAPGYSVVVKRKMDLTTIRKNIENGVIRTTAEFQRDVLLMLSNALMYNSREHSVYSMAKEMHKEAAGQLAMLLAAQAHAGLEPPPTRKRRRAAIEPASSKRQA